MISDQPPAVRSTLDVALWFVARGNSADAQMPPRKFHNLLYLAQALFAAENEGQMLAPATFLAAESGPIEPNIYQLFDNGPPLRRLNDIAAPVEDFLHDVWKRFGHMPTKDVESFVVRDRVWADALKRGRNSEITIEQMFMAYQGSRALGSTPQREAEKKSRKPGKEYWTQDGKKAERWIPGLSGKNKSDFITPGKKNGDLKTPDDKSQNPSQNPDSGQ